RAIAATRLFELAADDFAAALRKWFPMAVHLLDGLFLGLTSTEALLGQREKLAALGALSAGLAHEINNPAAAAVRGAQALRRRIANAAEAMATLVPGLPPGAMPKVVEVQAEAVRRAREAPAMSALE